MLSKFQIPFWLGCALAIHFRAMDWPVSIRGVNEKPFMMEICTNGLDDDGDGLIDINDPECVCVRFDTASLVPNPSFEAKACCPVNRSQLDCAVGWIQASQATTDYMNTCGYMAKGDFDVPMPLPAGLGFIGLRDGRVTPDRILEPGWKEYAGACLLAPMKAHRTYSFEFYMGFTSLDVSPSIEVTFFGTNDCKNLPFGTGNDQFGCPSNSNQWEKLSSTFVDAGGGNKWVKARIEITPEKDIRAIAVGPPCTPSKNPVSTYYFLDDLQLVEVKESLPEIFDGGKHPCDLDFGLQVLRHFEGQIQWYLNGIAIQGAQEEFIKPGEEGLYVARVEDNYGCYLTEPYDFHVPVFSDSLNITICKGANYRFGNQLIEVPGHYEAYFKSIDLCDSLVTLDLSSSDLISDTLKVVLIQGEKFSAAGMEFEKQGWYEIPLQSYQGCDSLLVIDLEVIGVYFPNIVKMSGARFKANYDTQKIEQIELWIYDRWGNLVFQGLEWEPGTNSKPVVPGVFTYFGKARFSDQRTIILSGDVVIVH